MWYRLWREITINYWLSKSSTYLNIYTKRSCVNGKKKKKTTPKQGTQPSVKGVVWLQFSGLVDLGLLCKCGSLASCRHLSGVGGQLFTLDGSIWGKCGNFSWQTPMSATNSSPPQTYTPSPSTSTHFSFKDLPQMPQLQGRCSPAETLLTQSNLEWAFLPFLENSVQFIHSVVSDSLWSHGLEHAKPPCPSPTPRAYSNSCPFSRWCHPTISSSVIPFSSCLQSFPEWGSFQMSQFFASGGQNTGVAASTSVLPMNIQD